MYTICLWYMKSFFFYFNSLVCFHVFWQLRKLYGICTFYPQISQFIPMVKWETVCFNIGKMNFLFV